MGPRFPRCLRTRKGAGAHVNYVISGTINIRINKGKEKVGCVKAYKTWELLKTNMIYSTMPNGSH